MSQPGNSLSEQLNNDHPNSNGPSGGLEYLNTSDLAIDDTQSIHSSSYQPIIIFLASTLVLNILSKFLMLYCGITPFEIVYSRGVISVILSMIYLKVNDIYLFSVETSKSSMVLAGSLAGFIAVGGYYLSLYHLNIVDAFSIDYLTAISALMIDFALFRGNLRFYQLIGLICSLAGLGFIARPGYLMSQTEGPEKLLFAIGIISGVVGVVFSGIYGGMLRRLFNRVNLLVLLTFMQFAMALFSPCFVLIHFEIRGKPTTYTFVSLFGLLLSGAIGWVAHWSLANSLKEEKVVSRIFPFKYVLIFIAILFDLIWFRMGLTMTSIMGVLLMGVNFAIGIYYLFFASN